MNRVQGSSLEKVNGVNRLYARRVVSLSVGIVLCCMAHVSGADADEVASIRVTTTRVLIPIAFGSSLDSGSEEIGGSRGVYALSLEVTPFDEEESWVLSVRADRPDFTPIDAEKPVSDIRWKLDHEGTGDYRPLDDREWIVFDNPEGGSVNIPIDIMVAVDWSTSPSLYSAGLIFSVKPR